MDIEKYLARIGYSASLRTDFQTLCGLQAAHMRSVPFENLDIIPLHRPIQLDETSLWDKLIVRKRGGFCYELNGLFAWLLKQAGFKVTYLNARVYRSTGELGIDFDHLALLAEAPGSSIRWLADVGFGDSFLEPLELREGEQPQGLRAYKLESHDAGYACWQRGYDGKWERQYFFDLIPRTYPSNYQAACAYHQTSPQSSFTRRPVISLATLEGRITLDDTRLIATRNGEKTEQAVTAEDWPRLLSEHFDIVL